MRAFLPLAFPLLAVLATTTVSAVAAESNGAAPAAPDPKAAPAPPPRITLDEKGFALRSDDDAYQLRVRGLVQGDSRWFVDTSGTNTFLLRRVRPILEGTVHRNVDFKVMPDFGNGQAVIYDAFVNVRIADAFQIQIGKFKPPVGLERLQGAGDIAFVERGLPTNLVPNRDVGVQLHGKVAKVLSWAIGVFNGVGDGAIGDADVDDRKDVAARVFVTPFARGAISALKGLGVGFAGSFGKHFGAGTAYKSPGQASIFQLATGTEENGTHVRLSPQAYWYVGPVGLLAEYVRSSYEVSNATAARTVKVDAWQVEAVGFVTGEDASYGGVAPKHEFGAIELHARYGELRILHDVFEGGLADRTKSARLLRAVGFGAAFHLARGVKFVVDAERTSFKGGAKDGDRPGETVVLSRFQVAF
jgi:phosphate-selective porin OprO and OprP